MQFQTKRPPAVTQPAAQAIPQPALQVAPGRASSSNNPVLFTAAAVCALIVLDTNVVAVSLPSIARTFHATFAEIEWVVSAYMVAFAACLLPAGGFADQFGRKKTLFLGLLIFALASVACGLAPSTLLLNLARAAKGVGAALLLTSALAVIANTFQEGPARTRAWAVWGTCMGLATTVAPLVGGIITQALNWRWIFLINLPITVVLAWCVQRYVTDSKNESAAGIDGFGSVLFGCALALIIWALIGAQEAGWASAATAWRFVAGMALCAAFIRVEARHHAAMMDLSLFRQARFIAAVLAMFGYAAAAQVMMTLLPLYLQNVYGYAPIVAGLGMLPFAVAMVAGPHLGRFLSQRYATYSILVLGLLLVAAGNLLLGGIATHADYGLAALGMCVTGLGAGVLNGDTQKAIMACVPASRTGMASGISTTMRFSGIVVAVGVLGAILNQRTRSVFDALLAAQPGTLSAVPPDFMTSMLAGDLNHVIAYVPEVLRVTLTVAARASFAAGFSSALYVAAATAAVVALAIRMLTATDADEHTRDERTPETAGQVAR